jgi:hypothetical protein
MVQTLDSRLKFKFEGSHSLGFRFQEFKSKLVCSPSSKIKGFDHEGSSSNPNAGLSLEVDPNVHFSVSSG